MHEKNNYVEGQLNVVKHLEPLRCLHNDLSKMSPLKLAQQKLSHVNPSIGSTIVEEYTNRTLGHKIHFLALSKRILNAGKKLGIIHDADGPMKPQHRLHATISLLVLDKSSYDQYHHDINQLKENASKIKAILSSKDMRELILILDNWKMNPDGNFGLQFYCDPSQNTTFDYQDFLKRLNHPSVNLSFEQKRNIHDALLSQPNVLNQAEKTVTMTRLQWIRFQLALAGAQIKAYHPGTFMVLSWVKDANQLKNHENLERFFSKVNDLVSNHIGREHSPDNVKEFVYNERTLHPHNTVDAHHVGKFAMHLSKAHLLTI